MKLLSLKSKLAEILFISVGVLTLPLWFPLLALYVILDPPYYLALWAAKKAQRRDYILSQDTTRTSEETYAYTYGPQALPAPVTGQH